jgi:hypothetical protein
VAIAFTLFSRLANADTSEVDNSLSKLTIPVLFSKERLRDLIPIHFGLLFPTTGQVLFLIVWLIMFVIVFLPARAKLLPLGYLNDTEKALRSYLTQFVPPNFPNDPKDGGVPIDPLAAKFRAQSFWPVGDGTAEYLSIGAFVVLFLIVAPVLPRSPQHGLYYLAEVFASYCCSKILFWYFKFRLSRVDQRLARAEKEEGE